jgi:hypothetical protein
MIRILKNNGKRRAQDQKNAVELGEGVVTSISQQNPCPAARERNFQIRAENSTNFFQSFGFCFDFFLFRAGFSVSASEYLSPLGALITFSHREPS